MPDVRLEGNWNGHGSASTWRRMLERLLPVVQRDVVFRCPHWRNQPPLWDGRFNVYFWSSPREIALGHDEYDLARAPLPELLYGEHVDCRDWGFFPTYEGYVVHAPEGPPVGQLLVNPEATEFYFLHDIMHRGENSEYRIGDRILSDLVVVLKLLAQPNGAALLEQRIMADRLRLAKLYAPLVRQTAPALGLAAARECVQQAEARFAESVASLTAWGMHTAVCPQLDFSALSARFGAEFDQIKALSEVEEVTVHEESQSFIVHTRELNCQHPETRMLHAIGRMRIHVSIKSGSVHFENVSGVREGLHAPGVGTDGEVFVAELRATFAQLIGRSQFLALITVALNYLKTIPLGAVWGRNVEVFPQAA